MLSDTRDYVVLRQPFKQPEFEPETLAVLDNLRDAIKYLKRYVKARSRPWLGYHQRVGHYTEPNGTVMRVYIKRRRKEAYAAATKRVEWGGDGAIRRRGNPTAGEARPRGAKVQSRR